MMAGDDLTASESAILMVLMAEAREIRNTELVERYGLDVRKSQRDKLVQRGLVATRKSGRTIALQLDDKGWVRMQSDLDFQLRGATALGAALTAVHARLRDRILDRSGCANLAELFSLTDMRSGAPSSTANLRLRIVHAYRELAAEPGDWVSLRRLRPFFADVARDEFDDALRRLAMESGVNVVPESNQRTLTAADAEAALTLGGQENHLLAIEA